MNTNLYNRDAYKQVIIPLRTDDDRDACNRLLRSANNQTLCQGVYSDLFIEKAIEQSDYILLRKLANNAEVIVAFALVQILKSNKLDILLVCTIPNKERFGNMIAYDVYSFAIRKSCRKIYTEPRTPDLRSTFLKYGFVHFRGVENINEVLEKEVIVQIIPKTNKTRRSTRPKYKPTTEVDEYHFN